MKTIYSLCLLLFLFSFSACQDDDEQSNSCQVKEPLTELPWLRQKVTDFEQVDYCMQIRQGVLRGQTVFIAYNCDPAAFSIPVVYDCSGTQISVRFAFDRSDDQRPAYSEIEDETIIWQNGK